MQFFITSFAESLLMFVFAKETTEFATKHTLPTTSQLCSCSTSTKLTFVCNTSSPTRYQRFCPPSQPPDTYSTPTPSTLPIPKKCKFYAPPVNCISVLKTIPGYPGATLKIWRQYRYGTHSWVMSGQTHRHTQSALYVNVVTYVNTSAHTPQNWTDTDNFDILKTGSTAHHQTARRTHRGTKPLNISFASTPQRTEWNLEQWEVPWTRTRHQSCWRLVLTSWWQTETLYSHRGLSHTDLAMQTHRNHTICMIKITRGQRHLAEAALNDPNPMQWHAAYTACAAANLSRVTDRPTQDKGSRYIESSKVCRR